MRTVTRKLWGTTIRVELDDPAQVFVGYWYRVWVRKTHRRVVFPLPCVVYQIDDQKGFVFVRDVNENRHLLARADYVFRRSRQPGYLRGEKKP